LEKLSPLFTENLMHIWEKKNPGLRLYPEPGKSRGFLYIFLGFILLLLIAMGFAIVKVLEIRESMNFIKPSYSIKINPFSDTKFLRYSYYLLGFFFLSTLIEFLRFCLKGNSGDWAEKG
jgi:hypothetical protein